MCVCIIGSAASLAGTVQSRSLTGSSFSRFLAPTRIPAIDYALSLWRCETTTSVRPAPTPRAGLKAAAAKKEEEASPHFSSQLLRASTAAAAGLLRLSTQRLFSGSQLRFYTYVYNTDVRTRGGAILELEQQREGAIKDRQRDSIALLPAHSSPELLF